jgi:hypothetical protein
VILPGEGSGNSFEHQNRTPFSRTHAEIYTTFDAKAAWAAIGSRTSQRPA